MVVHQGDQQKTDGTLTPGLADNNAWCWARLSSRLFSCCYKLFFSVSKNLVKSSF